MYEFSSSSSSSSNRLGNWFPRVYRRWRRASAGVSGPVRKDTRRRPNGGGLPSRDVDSEAMRRTASQRFRDLLSSVTIVSLKNRSKDGASEETHSSACTLPAMLSGLENAFAVVNVTMSFRDFSRCLFSTTPAFRGWKIHPPMLGVGLHGSYVQDAVLGCWAAPLFGEIFQANDRPFSEYKVRVGWGCVGLFKSRDEVGKSEN
uniref:Uncharacterized protein n=1 Tax=Lotharella globosa TaxID=91324 RepID=A0A6V3LUY2_9EUKA